MNFHLELLKSGCRKELKRRTGRSLDILEIRRHELVIGRSPTRARAGSATTPPWAACPSAAPRGSISAGRTA